MTKKTVPAEAGRKIPVRPGALAGSALGTGAALASGDVAVGYAVGAGTIAAGWGALGMLPGPWRWLPGQGEPWEWMTRAERRHVRRSMARMRRRLNVDPGPLPGWYGHEQRPQLLREATAGVQQARCNAMRALWQRALPDWERGWWRRYSGPEMLARSGPLAGVGASSLLELHPALRAGTILAASAWGWWVWAKPDPRVVEKPVVQDLDWYLARWAEHIAVTGGPLPGSLLTSARLDEQQLTAVILSGSRLAADRISADVVSIAFGVPARAVNIYRGADLPADRAHLSVRLAAEDGATDTSLAGEWATYTPWEGSVLSDEETTANGRRFTITMPRKGASVTAVEPRSIAQALDLPGEDAAARLHIRALDARRVEVSELTVNPLQGGVPLKADELHMDAQGYVTVGRDVYGTPATWRLLTPVPGKYGVSGREGASAVHSMTVGTTGAGKSSLEEALLIAQAANGFVSWLGDGKGGAGFASWFDKLDWIAKSGLGQQLMAQAASDVGRYRYSVQQKLDWIDADGDTVKGRAFFVPGEPFAPLQATFDEFNETVVSKAPHVKPFLGAVANLGKQTRAAGIATRVHLQIPNLDAIGSTSDAQAIRRMLQSGNIALFRVSDSESLHMGLGTRKPEFRLAPIPEKFPNGDGTGGLCYIADGGSQYLQSRIAYHHNPVKLMPAARPKALTDGEAEAAGIAYQLRDEYRDATAEEEEAFLTDLLKKQAKKGATTVINTAPAPAPAAPVEADDEDEDLDTLVPLTPRQRVYSAVRDGHRRNRDIARAAELTPQATNNTARRLERIGRLENRNREWHAIAATVTNTTKETA